MQGVVHEAVVNYRKWAATMPMQLDWVVIREKI